MSDITQHINTPSLDWMDAPIEAESWKNLYFMKDGKSYLGKMIFASEHKARSRAIEALAAAPEGLQVIGGPLRCQKHNAPCVWKKDISHHVQIPWNGP